MRPTCVRVCPMCVQRASSEDTDFDASDTRRVGVVAASCVHSASDTDTETNLMCPCFPGQKELEEIAQLQTQLQGKKNGLGS